MTGRTITDALHDFGMEIAKKSLLKGISISIKDESDVYDELSDLVDEIIKEYT